MCCTTLSISTKMVGTKNNSKNVSGVKVDVRVDTARTDNQIHKQKILLPTLKENQRYVVYKVIAKNVLKNFGDINNNILLQCNSTLGIFDGGNAGLLSAKYNIEKMTGVIRVNNKYVDKLKVCLGLIKNLNGQDVTVDCIYVSGMLHKAVDKMNA
jgi:RNase P/RNase MRP subunit POP5